MSVLLYYDNSSLQNHRQKPHKDLIRPMRISRVRFGYVQHRLNCCSVNYPMSLLNSNRMHLLYLIIQVHYLLVGMLELRRMKSRRLKKYLLPNYRPSVHGRDYQVRYAP